jgi:Spy/CpxP family protein refolding chaperone
MNRRQMVILPAVALAATRGFAQAQQPAATPAGSGTLSHKAMARYGRPKYAYKVPHGARKQAKYISFLTELLSLSPGQRAETVSIFAAAGTAGSELKPSAKANKKSLGASTGANDAARISKASLEIGKLAAQRHTIDAKASAAFFQILTPDQQETLTKFRS